MSYATDALLQALHYDPTKKTCAISAAIARLGESRSALRSAFEEEVIELNNVEILPTPAQSSKGAEELVLHGVGDVFGYHSRDIFLHFVLAGAEVQTLLMFIPFPEEVWQLSTSFPAVKKSPMMQNRELSLGAGGIVVSYGLSRLNGGQIAQFVDHLSAHLQVELKDGLQIVTDGFVNGSETLPKQWWDDAKKSAPFFAALPVRDVAPTRIDIRGDGDGGWLHLECWWDQATPLDGTGPKAKHNAGLAIHYNLKNPDEGFYCWLRELKASAESTAEPIILEAHIIEGFTPRYATRLGRLIPLGEGMAALNSLIGDKSKIITTLELQLPKTLSLISFIYSPGQSILFTVGAGSRTTTEEDILKVGPFELSEVDFTFAVPLTEGLPIVELTGFMVFYDVHFQVHVRTWDLIEAWMDEPDGVHLGQFIANALSDPLPFGLDTVTLRQAKLQRLLLGKKDGEATNRLKINLDGKVDLIPGAIVLEAISLDIHTPDQGKALGSIGALLTVGPVTLSVNAERNADGWTFDGVADASPEGISLTKLVDHLVHAFGATVPAEMPDVSLERIALSYDTATKVLDIQAITDWKIANDIPVLGGTESKAILHLIVSRDPQQGKTNATFSVNLTIQKKVGADRFYELDAYALLSSETQSFGFDFDAPTDTPLTLSEVATDLGLGYLPTPGANVLDAVFQLSSLSMNYAHPGNAFDIAWSRPLADGMFVAEYSQSGSNQPVQAGNSSKSGATNRTVDVSWLGNDENSTVGIQDVLKLVGQETLEDDIQNLAGDVAKEIVEKINELLTFKQLGFSWQENDKQSIVLFTALSTYRQGTKAFVAVRSGENECLVAGVSFAGSDDSATHVNLDDLTFLPDAVKNVLGAVEKVLEEVELTHILFSTVSSNAYQPPAFSAGAMQPSYARQNAAPPSAPFGSGTMALSQGVSIGARVKFGTHDIIRRVIDVDELDAQVTIGKVCALQVSIPGSLKLDAGGGNSLVLTSPMLQILTGPDFRIQGGLTVHLFGQLLDMSGWLDLAVESLTGHIQLKELPAALPPLSPSLYLPGVQIVVNEEHPLSLELGLQFEPSGLDLGLSGSFAIYKNATDLVYGDAVFVLEMVEEIPQPLYVEFGIDELSIPILLEAMTGVQYRLHLADSAVKLVAEGAEATDAAADLAGGDAGSAIKTAGEAADKAAKGASSAIEAAESALGHLEAILSKVEFKDVRFHWADSIVNLPDGSTVMPGVGIRGGLRIFDWDAFAVMDLSAQGIPGFSGHLEAEKIEIGRVLKIWGDGKGIHKTPTTAEDFNQQVKSKVDALAAGKPKSITPAAAKDEGAWFLEPGGPVLHLSTRSAPFLHADLHAQLFGFLQTDIHADITEEGFDFDFKIGAGNEVTADLECHWWHKEGKLEAHGDLGIHLHGDLGPIIPHVAATQFHLDTDLDAHVSLMVDSKEFKLTVNGSFEYQGASLHIPELVLTEQFSTLAELAKKVWEHIVAEAKNIFEEYLAPFGKFVEKGTKEVEDVAKKAAQAALDAAAPLLDKVEELGKKALQFAADATASVKAIGDDVAAIVSEAAHYAIQVAEEAARWVAEKLDEARRWVSARLDQAKALVSQLAREAEQAVQAIEAEIEEVGRQIEDLLGRAAHQVEDVASSGWNAVTSW